MDNTLVIQSGMEKVSELAQHKALTTVFCLHPNKNNELKHYLIFHLLYPTNMKPNVCMGVHVFATINHNSQQEF